MQNAFFYRDFGDQRITDENGVQRQYQRVIVEGDLEHPKDNFFAALRSSTSTWMKSEVDKDLSPILRYACKEISAVFQRQYLKHWKSHAARAYPQEVDDEMWNKYIGDISQELDHVVKKTVAQYSNKPQPPSARDIAVVENIPIRFKLVTRYHVFLGMGTHSHSPLRVPMLCQAHLNDIISLHCDASPAVSMVRHFPLRPLTCNSRFSQQRSRSVWYLAIVQCQSRPVMPYSPS